MATTRDPVADSLARAPRLSLPVKDGRVVIPPHVLTPGDSLVVDFHTGRITIQRGALVFAVIEPIPPIYKELP